LLVLDHLGEGGFKTMAEMLDAFMGFNDVAGMNSSKARDSFLDLIRFLRGLDAGPP